MHILIQARVVYYFTDGKSLPSTGIISRIHLSGDEVTAITCQEGGFVRKVSEDADTQHQTARCDEQQRSHLRGVNADRFWKTHLEIL